jgi:two-component sensor histidine kinase
MLTLTDRALGKWPRIVTDIIVAFAAMGFAIVARLAIDFVIDGTVPFAFSFPAVTAAALLAGWRAGLMTIAGCQLLVWYFVIPPERSFALTDAADTASLTIATLAQLMVVWAVSSYRSTAISMRAEGDAKIALMQLALQEMDHRTKNNFAIAGAMLNAQATGLGSGEAAQELRLAASRLDAIAATYADLAPSSANLSEIRLHDHLTGLCERLREGMVPEGVTLLVDAEPVTVDTRVAVYVGLIINEWITNAIKYAFPGGTGAIHVMLKVAGDGFEAAVSDNGIGQQQTSSRRGSGSHLTALLAQSIQARTTLRVNGGTHCSLHVTKD